MKKLLSLLFLLPLMAFGQTQGVSVRGTNGSLWGVVGGIVTNGNTLYVAPWGSDTNGNGSRLNPFKTAYDIWRAGDGLGGTFQGAGAYFAAQAGDTICWIGDTNFVPWLPPLDGVHLTTAPGTTLVRANFSNCVPILTANRDSLGPMIQPGDNSLVDFRGARLIANNPDASGVQGYNSAIGAFEGTDTRTLTIDYGTTNKVPNNAIILLPAAVGTTDCLDFVSTNTTRRTVHLYGGQIRSGWDSIRADGLVDLFVHQPDIFSTNTSSILANEHSRGIAVTGGVRLKVIGGTVGSGGGTVSNFPIAADGATTTVELDGVKLYRTSLSAAGSDIILTTSATAIGTYFGTTGAVVNISGPYIGNGAGLTNLPSTAVTPPGSTTQVPFNLAGVWAADAGFTYVAATDALTVVGTLSVGPITVTGANGITVPNAGKVGDTSRWQLNGLASGKVNLSDASFGNNMVLMFNNASGISNSIGGLEFVHTGMIRTNAFAKRFVATDGFGATGGQFDGNGAGLSNVIIGMDFKSATTAGSVSTSETAIGDLSSDLQGKLTSDLMAYHGHAAGTFVNSVSTKRLRLYLNSTIIFDTGAITVTGALSWDMESWIIRDSSTTARCTVKLNLSGASTGAYATQTDVTGITYSGTPFGLVLTGTSAGASVADNDIVYKMGYGELKR